MRRRRRSHAAPSRLSDPVEGDAPACARSNAWSTAFTISALLTIGVAAIWDLNVYPTSWRPSTLTSARASFFPVHELFCKPSAVPDAFHDFPVQRGPGSIRVSNLRVAVFAPIEFPEPRNVEDFLNRFSARPTMTHTRRLSVTWLTLEATGLFQWNSLLRS
jgi:hypothetical protein